MSTRSRLLLPAIAVTVVAVLALVAVWPGSTATPTGARAFVAASALQPTPAASVAPTSTTAFSPTSREVADGFEPAFSFVRPAGAEFEVGTATATSFELRIPAANDAGTPAGLIVQAVGTTRVDPCDAASETVPVDAGARPVIDHLREIAGLTVTDVTPFAVSGLPAVQATVRAGPETPGCPEIWLWGEATEAFTSIPRGELVRMVVVDVAGEHVVLTFFGEGTYAPWAALADDLLTSIRFVATDPSATGAAWRQALRLEPAGARPVVSDALHTRHEDARGDVPTAYGVVDILSLDVEAPCFYKTMCVSFEVAAGPGGQLWDAATESVAYGIVVDADGDGVGDTQVGIHSGPFGPRVWTTDLDAGVTSGRLGTSYGRTVECNLPWIDGTAEEPPRGSIGVTGAATEPMPRFYLWAAVMHDGAVVATDFAPGEGWLDAVR